MLNYVDLILLAFILFSIYRGFKKGFILSSLELFAFAASLWAAFSFYLFVATYLDDQFGIEERWLFPLSFFLTIIFFRIIIGIIIYSLLKVLSNKVKGHTLNKAMGIIPGAIKGICYSALIAILFLFIPLWPGLTAKTRESTLASAFTQKIEEIDQQIAPEVSENIKQSISRLTIEPESNETVLLHFTVPNPVANPQFEAQLLDLVNKERKKAGENLLTLDPKLRDLARAQSKDMFQRGYFSHINPENQNPFDRMKAKGITYTSAGENLALAQTVEIAHTGLMNSPGHRANILNPKFNRIGIGIMDGGIYGVMVTQSFRN